MIKKLRYLFTLMLLLVASVSWAEEVVYYTLDGTITGGSNAYATESEITQGDITWMVTGNTTISPWRIGGKSLTNVDRTAYSQTAMGAAISKIVVTLGTSSLTVNSLKLTVASDAGFSNVLEEITAGEVEGAYYKLTFNLTETSGSNKFVQLSKVIFYKEKAADEKKDATVNIGATSLLIGATTEVITDGPVLTLTTSDANIASVNGTTVTGVAAGTATITATWAENDEYLGGSKEFIVTVTDPNAPGTENNPYTVAQARAAIDAGTGTSGVYATGIVSAIPTAYSSEYKNITFNFVDEAGDAVFLQAYRCGGDEAANVEIGDIVVVYGNLTKYNSTYEFGSGCQLVSLTHADVAVPTFSPEAGVFYEAQNVSISCETEGATIKYSTDNATWADYTAPIAVAETTTIYAKAVKGTVESTIVSATYEIRDINAEGGPNNPYTVAQALNLTNYPANGIYVHGIVSTAPTQAPTSSGQLTYFISDNGEATNQLEVYKGKGLNQKAFTAQDDIQVGDIVTIYGNVKIYNEIKEFDTDNYLVSFERPTSTEPAITVAQTEVNVAAAGGEGTIEVTYENIEEIGGVQTLDASGAAASYDWIVAELNTDNNIEYIVEENTSA